MYISKIHLQNIRGFRPLELACQSNHTLIIGKNGTGKTTLLRAIALGLSPEEDGRALLAEPIGEMATYSEKINFGSVGLELSSPERDSNREVVISRIVNTLESGKGTTGEKINGRKWVNSPLPERWDKRKGKIVVVGYGPGRSYAGSEAKSGYRLRDSVLSLFNYRTSLLSPELTLRRLRDYFEKAHYETTLERIKYSLDLGAEDKIHFLEKGGIGLSGPTLGRQIPLEAWADGYRLTFTWLIDLYGWAMQADSIDKTGNVHGIVLIDEIEQHLHPSLQTGILPRLKEILPFVQIIATTHSPLVALGTSPENLVVLRREDDKVVREMFVPDIRGYSVEDMLVEERLFNTPEVYSPETNRKLAEYQALVEIPKEKRDAEQASRLRILARELQEQQVPEVRQPSFDPALKALLEKYAS
ncbi:MAG: AAA family ATPase [Anaerolineales bacterium]|nr:AAA family ATPase [Anaerolineales bacterium]